MQIHLKPAFQSWDGNEMYVNFPESGVTESIGVEQVAEHCYRILTIPLTPEVGFQDVIEVIPGTQTIFDFYRVVEPANWQRFEFVMHERTLETLPVQRILAEVVAQGGEWNQVFGGMLLMCLPPDSNFNPAEAIDDCFKSGVSA